MSEVLPALPVASDRAGLPMARGRVRPVFAWEQDLSDAGADALAWLERVYGAGTVAATGGAGDADVRPRRRTSSATTKHSNNPAATSPSVPTVPAAVTNPWAQSVPPHSITRCRACSSHPFTPPA